MRNAVLPSSPSEITVSPALSLTVCIDVTSKTADGSSMFVGGMIGRQNHVPYRFGLDRLRLPRHDKASGLPQCFRYHRIERFYKGILRSRHADQPVRPGPR